MDQDDGKKMDTDGSYGYFTMLAVKFTSSLQQIDRNYNTIMKYYNDKELSQGDNSKNIEKIKEAYNIIKNDDQRQFYMHKLIIRCYLSQPPDLMISKKENSKLWPFFIFEVIKEGNKQTDILQFNFVSQTLTEQQKEVQIKAYVFSNISSALYSKKDDEFIINFIDNGKILSQNYKAKFQNQRDQIVKLAIFAKEIFEETKPTLEFYNPNTKQDMNLFKVSHFSIGESSKTVNSKVSNLFLDQTSTRNNFLWNDSYIPSHSLFKGQAQKIARLGQSKTIYFTIGKTQMLLSRDEEVKQIIQVIPLKKEYLAFSREENVVQLQVLNNTRKYRFHDKQNASSFVQKLISVQNQKAQAQPLMTTHPYEKNLQTIAQNQIEKIQQIDDKIKKYENQIQQLRQKKQQILSELNELDLENKNVEDLYVENIREQQRSPEHQSLYKAPMKIIYLKNPDPVFYSELDIRLQKTLGEVGLAVREVNLEHLHLEFDHNGVQLFSQGELLDFDGFLSWGYMHPKHMQDYNYLIAGIEAAGKVILHSTRVDRILQNKLLQGLSFAKGGVPIPKSLAAFAVPSIKQSIQKNYGFNESGVVKALDGYGGDGVQLARCQEEIISVGCKLLWKASQTVIQKFVPDSIGKSIRALVMDGKVVALAQYHDQGSDFRSNNGYYEMFQLVSLMDQKEKYEKVAIDAVSSIDPEMTVGGVDILDSTSFGQVVLEINGWPDLYDTEKSTGVNTFRAVAESFLNRLKRHYKR
ncbi:hypothetical protein pb186bvf_015129 [Paramecium bursaria]